jgi:hypothetical protein
VALTAKTIRITSPVQDGFLYHYDVETTMVRAVRIRISRWALLAMLFVCVCSPAYM